MRSTVNVKKAKSKSLILLNQLVTKKKIEGPKRSLWAENMNATTAVPAGQNRNRRMKRIDGTYRSKPITFEIV